MYIKFKRSLNDPIFCCTLAGRDKAPKLYMQMETCVLCIAARGVLIHPVRLSVMHSEHQSGAPPTPPPPSGAAALTTAPIIVRCGLFICLSGLQRTPDVGFHLQIDLILPLFLVQFSPLEIARRSLVRADRPLAAPWPARSAPGCFIALNFRDWQAFTLLCLVYWRLFWLRDQTSYLLVGG